MAKATLSKKNTTQNEEVKTENTTPEVEVDESVANQKVEDKAPDAEPEVEVTGEQTEGAEPEVEVATKEETIDDSKRVESRVKIRMRVDHTCTIAMERYEFKQGEVYRVPRNVKRMLNRAGLLAPL